MHMSACPELLLYTLQTQGYCTRLSIYFCMLSFFTNKMSGCVTPQQAMHTRSLGLSKAEADYCDLLVSWAAQYSTGLLNKLTSKGVVLFSLFFLTFGCSFGEAHASSMQPGEALITL